MLTIVATIQVGNEFSSVEALWSTFETVMAKEPEQPPMKSESEGEGEGGGGGPEQHQHVKNEEGRQ
jgi:DASH complex subunit DAD1